MKKLIINADDFGLHSAVNQAVLRGFTTGCITSASLMAGGAAFDEAVTIAKANPGLGIGAHLTLVAGRPVLDPGRVPTLIDKEGAFAEAYPLLLKNLLQGRVRRQEIYCELRAQVQKIIDSGLKLTHFDSHQHMHVVPGILDVVLELAREFGVRAIRLPQEPLFFVGGCPAGAGRLIGRGGLSVLAGLARRKIRRQGMGTTDSFFGMLAGGQLREELLLNILAGLPEGSSEIMMHPAVDNRVMAAIYSWGYQWESELAAVTGDAAKKMLERYHIELISFEGVVT